MNGLDKIIEKIHNDVADFVTETQAEAKEQADALAAMFDQIAGQKSDEIFARGKEQAAEVGRRAVSVAQLEARKAALAKKQELISVAFDRAEEQLLTLSEDAYLALLCKFAVSSAVSGREEIVLNQKDRVHMGEQLVLRANQTLLSLNRPHQLTLSDETREMEGGLYLKEGSVEINCTILAIVSVMREKLAHEIAEILFS